MAPVRLNEDILHSLNCSKLRVAHALLTILVTCRGAGTMGHVVTSRILSHAPPTALSTYPPRAAALSVITKLGVLCWRVR